jgi:hypothetical protein
MLTSPVHSVVLISHNCLFNLLEIVRFTAQTVTELSAKIVQVELVAWVAE